MEIYTLKDEIKEKRISKKTGDELIITDLKQGVKNPNRVNVYVDSEFAFSLDLAQIVDLGVKVGRKISSEELLQFKNASDYGKLYQRALEWVLIRPRSKRETYDYLSKKIYEKKLDKGYIDVIIKQLEEKKYLDDKAFAKYYVENRFVKKGISRKRLDMELTKKGIAKEIIEEVLGERNDEEEIRKIITHKGTKYDNEKLIEYLCRQGFSYDLVKTIVNDSLE